MKKKTGKRTRIRWTVLLLLSICLTLGACSAKKADTETSPQDTAKYAMEALKQLDLETWNRYTDNYVSTEKNWIGIPVSREYRVFNELLQPGLWKGKRYQSNYRFAQGLVKHLTWKIEAVRENGESAEIDMVISNRDMKDVTGNYLIYVMEEMLDGVGTGIKAMLKNLADLDYDKERMRPFLEEADGVISVRVTVTAVKKNGQWRLHLSDSFINAFFGNFMADQFSPEVEKRLEELEGEYERKIEQWGDEFGDNIEKWAERMFE